MVQDTLTLARLIGSRICHDIISPIGAISNGLELIELSGKAETPEIALISESVAGANARIRFFRVAMGLASPEQQIGASEAARLANDYYAGGRITIEWNIGCDLRRDEIQALYLALLCLSSAMPLGGHLSATEDAGEWVISCEASQTRISDPLWNVLHGASVPNAIQPAEVQFPMLAACAEALGRRCTYEASDTQIAIRL